MTIRRVERVADQIRGCLANCVLQELRDPGLGFITITQVKLSPDLRHAIIFVTVMPPEKREESLAALNRARPFLRRALAREIRLRFTPELKFLYDDVFEGGLRLEQILRDDPAQPEPPEDEDA
jgi:ribosome-binding factor A